MWVILLDPVVTPYRVHRRDEDGSRRMSRTVKRRVSRGHRRWCGPHCIERNWRKRVTNRNHKATKLKRENTWTVRRRPENVTDKETDLQEGVLGGRVEELGEERL